MEQIYQYFSQLLASNQFLQGGFVLGVLTAVFYQLKTIPVFLWNKIRYYATYTVYMDESTDIYLTFADWFQSNYPQKFRNVEVKFYYNDEPRSSANHPVAIESNRSARPRRWSLKKHQYADSNVIFYQNRWLWISKERQKLENAQSFSSLFLSSYSISGLFAKKAIDALCEEILDRKIAESESHALRVGINTNDGYFEFRHVEIVKTLDHIFFSDKAKLIADIDTFVTKKEFYRSKGINFKRSYMFYGPGGTGKTSLATAIAKYLEYDLCVINLASIKDDGVLQRCAQNIRERTVILLEDIDCVLSARNVKNPKVNFSTVLNFLDGIYAPSDCVFVMTTNHPEVLDEAMTRKGRVDLSLLIDYPTGKDIEDFMCDFYEEKISMPVQIENKIPMSEVQDICLRNDDPLDARKEILTAKRKNGKVAEIKNF